MARLFAFALLAPAFLSAGDYLPLEPGNTWTYRHVGGRDTFTISAGLEPAVVGSSIYYRLTGYASQPLWVRSAGDGLYYRDDRNGSEALLTPFTPSDSWTDAPFRSPCIQQARAAQPGEPYDGPAGRFGPPLPVMYRVSGCADAGIVREDFLENIGMVRREVTTIAGPRVYELVHARVGGITLGAKPGAAFRVSVDAVESTRVAVSLHLSVFGPPVKLVFGSSQEYDLQLRDAVGNVMYTWSEGKAFLMAIHERTAEGDLAWTVEIPLADPLKPGRYQVLGWLATGPAREFASTANFDVGGAASVTATACGRPNCSATRDPAGRRR